MLYVIRVFENGGILCCDKKPQIVKSGLLKGLSRMDGNRYQVASIERELAKKFDDPDVNDAAKSYISTLQPGDQLTWAMSNEKAPNVVVDIEGERTTLTRKWADIDINRLNTVLEAHVNATVDADA